MTEIIAAGAAILAALVGAFVGQLWGRMRGEHDGRASALQDMEREQANAYRKAREKADAAPTHSGPSDARGFLRNRRDEDQ